ncbi:hypothetical protein CSKR_101381 [Clonorchis sinensis]|uniref:C2H2-type domain-containing protein n=2 Tax=Clonorchis sinensis TaxID=79923 RepID=A0A3R7C889_CLOSI|nr:hypothetical protein CSKR_101381 [Clonorchis sinensis]
MSVISPVPLETHSKTKKQHFVQTMDSNHGKQTSIYSLRHTPESPGLQANSRTSPGGFMHSTSSGENIEDRTAFQAKQEEGESHLSVSYRETNSSSSHEPSPRKRHCPDLADIVSSSPLSSSTYLISNSLPCPCGRSFSDSTNFIEHARQCVEFAKTATSFAEAAAAVASSTILNDSRTSSPSAPPVVLQGSHRGEMNNSTNGNVPKLPVDDIPIQTSSKTVSSSNTYVNALDLSLRPEDFCANALIQCPDCKFSVKNADSLLNHFESEHNLKGKFACHCADTFGWLPNLLKHQLKCKKLSETRGGESDMVFVGGHHNPVACSIRDRHPPAPNTVDLMSGHRPLSCTGCGRSGFQNTNELLKHFGQCNQMTPQTASSSASSVQKTMSGEQTKLPPLPSHSSVPISANGTSPASWNHIPASSALSLSPNMFLSTTYHMNKSYELGRSSPTKEPSLTRFPLGLLQPLGMCGLPRGGSIAHQYFSPKLGYPPAAPPPANSMASKSFQRGSALKTTDSTPDSSIGNIDLSRPFKCCHCIKAFKSKALLDQHMHIHYPPKYTCRYCAKKYRWPPVFYHHQRTCKKRPPVTSGTSIDNNAGGMTVSCALNSRTHSVAASETPLSSTIGSGRFPPISSIFSHNASPQIGKVPSNPMMLFPPFPLPLSHNSSPPDWYSANNISETHCHSIAEREPMGFAALAAAAAMGVRFPLTPIPPPLGLADPYIRTQGSTQTSLPYIPGTTPYNNIQTTPLIPSGFFSPFLSTTPSSQPVTSLNSSVPLMNTTPNPDLKPSFPTSLLSPTISSSPDGCGRLDKVTSSSPKAPSVLPQVDHGALKCVCGTHFEDITLYLVHMPTCSALQHLVSLAPLSKASETRLNLNSPWFPPVFPILPFPFGRGHFPVGSNPSSEMQLEHSIKQGKEADGGEHSVSQNSVLETDELPSQARFTISRLAEKMKTEKRTDLKKADETHESRLNYPINESGNHIWSDLFGSPDFTAATYHGGKDCGFVSMPTKITGTGEYQKTNQDVLNPKRPTEIEERQDKSDQNENDCKGPRFFSDPRGLNQNLPHYSKNFGSFPESSSKHLDSSTSLMAAMATVLANAAAAAGFGCSGLARTPETGSDLLEQSEYALPSTPLTNGMMSHKLCVQCGKEFSSRLSLKQHVEGKHSAEGKYQCPGCAKRYRWGASYYYHKKSCAAIREQSSPVSDSNGLTRQMSQEENSPNASSCSPLNFHQNGECDLSPGVIVQRCFADDRDLLRIPSERGKFDIKTPSSDPIEETMNCEMTDSAKKSRVLEIWPVEDYTNQFPNHSTLLKETSPNDSDNFSESPHRGASSSVGDQAAD